MSKADEEPLKVVKLPRSCNPYGLQLYQFGDESKPSYIVMSLGSSIAQLERKDGNETWTLEAETTSAVEGVAMIRAAEDIREGRGAPEVLNRDLPPRWVVFGERPGGPRVAGKKSSKQYPKLHGRP